jgi:tetratricopeptide (TPR) repeat protein
MYLSKPIAIIVIMSLSVPLSSSSFFLDKYLNKIILDKSFSNIQLSYAISKKITSALNIALEKVEYGSRQWLVINRELAKTNKSSALALAKWYQNFSEDNKALSKQAELWLKQAIRLKSQKAILALSEYYFDYNYVSKARDTFELLNSDNLSLHDKVKSYSFQFRLNIHLGDIGKVTKQIHSLPPKLLQINEISDLLNDIERYNVIDVSNINQTLLATSKPEIYLGVTPKTKSCISDLQLFATNLKHLRHLQRLIINFKKQEALAKFVCLPVPKYINPKYINCNAEKASPITCDETLWQVVKDNTNTRHVGLMLNEGGANVHLGILYFDSQDDINVFSHEISHLLGFIDEYPLAKTHQICQQAQMNIFSHNIAVIPRLVFGHHAQVRERVLANIPWASLIKEDTPIIKLNKSVKGALPLWEVGTPEEFTEEVGVFKAETCGYNVNESLSTSANNNSAYKPLVKRTLLRTTTSEFPELYIKLLVKQPTSFLMPSYDYNIALAFYRKGNMDKARFWLNKAARWEQDKVRKKRVLMGDF